MEYNDNEMFQQQEQEEAPVILKEKKSGSTLWYWVLALLVIGVLIWFGVTSGWFTSSQDDVELVDYSSQVQVEEVQKNLAKIDAWEIQTTDSFPIEKTLVLSGNMSDSCTYLDDVVQIREGNSFMISLPLRVEEGICTQALVPFEKSIELDVLGLPAGVYVIDINGQQISFELEQDNVLDFSAGDFK